MREPSKAEVVAALAARIAGELDALLAVTAMARDEATGEQSRPENEYDTRALEASYLAAGQGKRLVELEALRDWFAAIDPSRACARVGLGALARVEDEGGGGQWLFFAPTGGTTARVGDVEVRVVSPASPLGHALAGLAEGDEAELEGPRGARTVAVERVR